MAWAKPTNITAWSFSRLKSYETCPFKLKLTAIDKLKEPSSPAMERGTAIHKLAEDYIKGGTRNLPPELKTFDAFFKRMKALFKKDRGLMTVEATWAFRKDWTMTTWNDWNGCWLRVKVDVSYHTAGTRVMIVDHKTGKYAPEWNVADYMDQVELYAAAALVVYADTGPDLEVVPVLHFIDANVVHPAAEDQRVFTPKDLPALKKKWEKRVAPMLADKKFAPKPNKYCYNCFFRNSNAAAGGGQCKF